MISKRSILMLLVLLVPAGLALAADAPACKLVPGDYVINVSGFGGGAPVFYPMALVGKITVDEDGNVAGSYKRYAPVYNGVASKKIKGEMKINKDCTGSLAVKEGDVTTHTFAIYVAKGNVLNVAAADVGMILSGTVQQ